MLQQSLRMYLILLFLFPVAVFAGEETHGNREGNPRLLAQSRSAVPELQGLIDELTACDQNCGGGNWNQCHAGCSEQFAASFFALQCDMNMDIGAEGYTRRHHLSIGFSQAKVTKSWNPGGPTLTFVNRSCRFDTQTKRTHIPLGR